MAVLDAEPWQPRWAQSRSVLGADWSRWWRRGHRSDGGATTTSTTTADTHPKPSASSRSPAFTEDVPESVEEFGAHLAVVERQTHVVSAVEDHVDQVDDEDRRR